MWLVLLRILLAWCLLTLLLTPLRPSMADPQFHGCASVSCLISAGAAADSLLRPQQLELIGRARPAERGDGDRAGKGKSITLALLDADPAPFPARTVPANRSYPPVASFPAGRTLLPRAPPI